MVWRLFSKTCVWMTATLVMLFVCLDVEFEWVLIPCRLDERTCCAINRIILTISYSYIAAAIFYFIVNYCPFKLKEKTLRSLLNHKILTIKELLRLSWSIVLPPFDLSSKTYSKIEYCQLFSSTDLYEKYPLSDGKTKYDCLNELKNKINEECNAILLFGEYLEDEQFTFVTNVVKSTFVNSELKPNNREGNNYNCNQDKVGDDIYTLYEASKKIGENLS